MIARFYEWLLYIRKHWIIALIIAMVLFGLTIFAGYWFNWTWTGFNPSIGPNVQQYQPGKTLWDWLQLAGIIAIPFVVGLVTIWFNTQQSRRSETENNQRHKTDLEIAEEQRQDAALQTCLDRISTLLLEKDLRRSPRLNEVRNVARAYILTTLRILDEIHKGSLISFLLEADLLLIESQSINDPSVINLDGADLRGVDLSGVDLTEINFNGANLSGANLSNAHLGGARFIGANLSGANLNNIDWGYIPINLRRAKLNNATLVEADLSLAYLGGADLTDADLSEASLGGAYLSSPYLYDEDICETDIHFTKMKLDSLDLYDPDPPLRSEDELYKHYREEVGNVPPGDNYNHNYLSDAENTKLKRAKFCHADLSYANLSRIDLSEIADLSGADLNHAYLYKSVITFEQKAAVKSLEGAIMPDGKIYP